MRRAFLIAALAIAAGVGAAEYPSHSFAFRHWLGHAEISRSKLVQCISQIETAMAEPGHAEACPSGGTRFRASTLAPVADGLGSIDTTLH